MSMRIEVKGWVLKGESKRQTLHDVHLEEIKAALGSGVFDTPEDMRVAYEDDNVALKRISITAEISVEDV